MVAIILVRFSLFYLPFESGKTQLFPSTMHIWGCRDAKALSCSMPRSEITTPGRMRRTHGSTPGALSTPYTFLTFQFQQNWLCWERVTDARMLDVMYPCCPDPSVWGLMCKENDKKQTWKGREEALFTPRLHHEVVKFSLPRKIPLIL